MPTWSSHSRSGLGEISSGQISSGQVSSGQWTRRGVLAIGAAASAAAFASDDQAQRDSLLAEAHLARRLPVIRSALASAKPGFVFLAGNSHAELVGSAMARLLPVVDGGIGGASARSYAIQLEALPFGARAGVAVLFLGTNDILRRAAPLSEHTLAGFTGAVTRVLDSLLARADLVLVAAVPPLGPEASAARDPAAVAVYTAVLRSLCARDGCRFFDPFAGLRDGEAGLTTHAAPLDGVHLRDYAALAADLATLLRDIGPGRTPVGER